MRHSYEQTNMRGLNANMAGDLTTDSEIMMNIFETEHNPTSSSNNTYKNRQSSDDIQKQTTGNNLRYQTPTPFGIENNLSIPSFLTNSITKSTPLNFMKQYQLPDQSFISSQQQYIPQQHQLQHPQQQLQQGMNFYVDSPQFDNFFSFTPKQTQKTQISNQKTQSRPHSRAQQHYSQQRQQSASQKPQLNFSNDIPLGLSPNLSTPLANKSSISMFDTPYFNNLFMNCANYSNSLSANIDFNQMPGSNSQLSKIIMNVDTPLLDSIEKVLTNSTPLPRVNNKNIKKLNNSYSRNEDLENKQSPLNNSNKYVFTVRKSTTSERCQDIIRTPTEIAKKNSSIPNELSKPLVSVSCTPIRNTKDYNNKNVKNQKSYIDDNKGKSANVDESFDNSDEMNKNNIIINSSPSTIIVSSASKSVNGYRMQNMPNVETSPTPANKYLKNITSSMSFNTSMNLNNMSLGNMSHMGDMSNIDFNIDPSLRSNNIPEAPVMGVFKESANKSLRKTASFQLSSANTQFTIANEIGGRFMNKNSNGLNTKGSNNKFSRSISLNDSIISTNNKGKKRKPGTKGGIQFVMTDPAKLKGNKKRRTIQAKKTIPLSNTTNIINNKNNAKMNEKLEMHKQIHTFKTKSEPQFINKDIKEKEN